MITIFEEFINDTENFLNQPQTYKANAFIRKRRKRPKKTFINELPGATKNVKLFWDRYF